MSADDKVLQVTVAFAPYEAVLPVVAGLFRAQYGYARAVDPAPERQWARLARLERERTVPTLPGEPTYSVHSVRLVKPAATPKVTVIEDFFGTDQAYLAKLLPGVRFLHMFSEFCRKDAERHCYQWREDGEVVRRVYFHHNYQVPGWHWEETGPRQPWEDQDRMGLGRISKRCDRALMLEYAARLGCDLAGALGGPDWAEAVLLYDVNATDCDDTPPTALGDAVRREAVTRGFGQGEEGVSFEGYIADNRQDACAFAYMRALKAEICKTRSARRLLDLMSERASSPDAQDVHSIDVYVWNAALARAEDRFPDAPETAELKRLAQLEIGSRHGPFRP